MGQPRRGGSAQGTLSRTSLLNCGDPGPRGSVRPHMKIALQPEQLNQSYGCVRSRSSLFLRYTQYFSTHVLLATFGKELCTSKVHQNPFHSQFSRIFLSLARLMLQAAWMCDICSHLKNVWTFPPPLFFCLGCAQKGLDAFVFCFEPATHSSI